MKAVTYQGFRNVQVKDVPDPAIQDGQDMIVRITTTSICGSDLHLFHGMLPSLEKDYIIGHEAVGVVEEIGSDVYQVKKGDRVVIPFTIGCGTCIFCRNELESQCNRSNKAGEAGGVFGYTRLYGDFDGCQAEYVRVPFANFTSFVLPPHCEMEEENLMLLADALPTSYWGVINAGVKPGDVVIVLGSGPIGLLVQKFAWKAGASRVIVVDCIKDRLVHAKRTNQTEIYNLEEYTDLHHVLRETTKGGADVVIDCAGADSKMQTSDVVQTFLHLQGGTLEPIKMASQVVRKGGTIQLIGLYGTRYNAFPLGDLFSRNITLKMGIAPATHLIPRLYEMMVQQKFDPSDVISHKFSLQDAQKAYRYFDKKTDGCLKVVLQP